LKNVSLMNSRRVYIEITQSVLRALGENGGIELSLDRDANGRLSAVCKEKLISSLAPLVNRKSWQPRMRAFCAIGASGVSLRRFSLPGSAKEDLHRLLLLQIESEFPLPPSELAWGWRQIESGTAGKRDVLVAAVKKDIVQEYADLLSSCGLEPVFTLAALARNYLCPQPRGSHALLQIGRTQSELATFERGEPVSLRVVSPGAEAVTKALGAAWNGSKLFVFGAADDVTGWSMPGCELIPIDAGPGRSAATLGLKKSVEQNGGSPGLVLQITAKAAGGKLGLSQPDVKKWLERAAILLVALLALPIAEAILLKPILAKRVANLKAQKEKVLPVVERELDFLQSLKQSQPPYLDALYVFSKSSAQGTKIESVNMNRRGEISLKGSMQNGQAVTDFRTKLIASGFFSNVAVEEQSPTPDRQKVNVRMTMQWKSPAERAALAIGPTTEEIERAKTNKVAQAGGGGSFPPGMMMPPGAMPAGAMPVMPEGMPVPRPRR
jgi:hypothetical protein